MNYEDVLNQCPDKLPTLGELSAFTIERDGSRLVIVTSGNERYTVTPETYDKVLRRYRELPPGERNRSCNYTDPVWSDCPHRVVSPYLPAIWRFFAKEQTAET